VCKNFSKIVLAVIIWSCSLGNGAELTDIDCYYVFPTVLVFPEIVTSPIVTLLPGISL
jgi:hypothetical protein